jgi:hypothetical protein
MTNNPAQSGRINALKATSDEESGKQYFKFRLNFIVYHLLLLSYYLVLPPKHCLPFVFNGIKERPIESYMRKWDEEIAGKELAEAHASAACALRTSNGRARRKAWDAAARAQDRENGRARKRVWEQCGLSLDSI